MKRRSFVEAWATLCWVGVIPSQSWDQQTRTLSFVYEWRSLFWIALFWIALGESDA